MKRLNTKYIVIHCSDTPSTMDIGAKEIREWHTAAPPHGNGWKDIGYHYVIRRNGVIEEGREIEEVGSHVKGFNSSSVGICMVGGRHGNNDFTKLQFETLEGLIKRLAAKYPEAVIVGHRDLATGKQCPSFDVQDWLETVTGVE